jgi:hypothetical protein
MFNTPFTPFSLFLKQGEGSAECAIMIHTYVRNGKIVIAPLPMRFAFAIWFPCLRVFGAPDGGSYTWIVHLNTLGGQQ